jgi:pimeloyl-ACP methyl ester carboxylesterase
MNAGLQKTGTFCYLYFMQHLLLLHGAIGAKDQLEPLQQVMSRNYQVHSLNFNGHGGTPVRENAFSIAGFAEDISAWLSNNTEAGDIYIFGYSMGGYAALKLAHSFPGRIKGIITLATKFQWDPETAVKETAMLNPGKIEEKLPDFAAALRTRHQPGDWKKLLEMTAAMLRDMGDNNPLKEEDYAGIDIPCLLMLGDRDKMVSLEETLAVFRKLPKAGLSVLPQTAHPIEKTDTERLAFEISSFISKIESSSKS